MPLSQRDLLPILHSRRGFGVKDPRDMIYAHLGIVDTNSELARLRDFIQVDYNKTIREVYMDAALDLIQLRRNFDILSHVCYREGQVTCGPVIEKAKIELI
jgi:hypothetical protein